MIPSKNPEKDEKKKCTSKWRKNKIYLKKRKERLKL